jgi:hypothetical protein
MKFEQLHIWFLLAAACAGSLILIASGPFEARLVASVLVFAMYCGLIRIFGRGFVLEGLIATAALTLIAFFILQALPMLSR